MEFVNMNELWAEENKKLKDRILVNEDLLKKMSMEKSISEFDKLLTMSILGRNLALVFALISLIFAAVVWREPVYFMPAVLGAAGMVWSFIMHLPLKRPKFESLSVIELQKEICKFRIHTAHHSKYDIELLAFWTVTLAPIVAKLFFHFLVYETLTRAALSCVVAFVFGAALYPAAKDIYKQYEEKLKASEEMLARILEFEKN